MTMAAKVGPLESERHRDLRNIEVTWIRDHIKMRKCSYYIPSETKNICQCGYEQHGHEHIAFGSPERDVESNATKLKWNFREHTVTEPTDAFGEIEFVGFGGNIGKFVRVDRQTDMHTMLNLMLKEWGMEKPNLIISVTGGARNFNMKPRLRDMFLSGLMKAAHSTGAWIITAGYHTGVMKHVGEAVKKYGLTSTNQKHVVAIGIASWGVIQNRDALINKEGSWPAEYRIEEDLNSNEIFLDPNHSHFILIDDGTQHRFATEIPFRAELEREISEMKTDTGDDAVSVPIVILVVEGGPGSLEMVQNALMQNTTTVILKESGRTADILSYAFKYAETVEVDAKDKRGIAIKITEKHLSSSLEAEIYKQMIETSFCPEQDIDINMQRIKDCLAKSELIYIFEWDSDMGAQDIDVAMLKALMKVNKNHVMDQLQLALAWNKIEIAKDLLFTDDKRRTTGSLDDIMLTAIQLNRVNFVELFLDNGVSLTKFLTKERLLFLYSNVSRKSFFKNLLSMMRSEEGSAERISFYSLVRRKQNEEYPKKVKLVEVRLLLERLLGESNLQFKRYKDKDSTTAVKPDDGHSQKISDDDNPCLDLFIWSVLNNRQDMAKCFWRHGKDAMATALFAHVLLSAMSRHIDDKDFKEQCEEHGRQFLDFAIGILKEAYSTDARKSHSLLIQNLSQWGHLSRLQIAVKSESVQFISLTACQDLFNSIWMGEMTQDNNIPKLLLCTVCPPLIPLIVRFKENEHREQTSGDYTTMSHIQMKQKSKPPLLRGSPNASLKQSHLSLQELATTDDSKDEKQVEGNYFRKLVAFYQAPVIIFCHNVVSSMIFLCLYSYILISKFDENLSTEEIILIVWVFTIAAEEVRQVYAGASETSKTKVLSYITDGWNQIDVITLVLFAIGMILRSIPYPQTLEAARIFLGVNLVTFFIRLLHFFTVHKELGPKLVMIIHAIRNLIYFFVILLVFIVAYAIASYAILYPKTELSLGTLIAIFRRPYWNIYGELMLDEIEGAADCTNVAELYGNGTHPRCPTESGQYFVPVLMGLYMLMCNILLLNLLIVMFSYTFQSVHDNIDTHWSFQLLSLIHDYYNRSSLAPPLIIIEHFAQLIIFCMRRCCCSFSFTRRGDAFLKYLPEERILCAWEAVIAASFRHKNETADHDRIDNIVKGTALRVDQLVNKINELQEQKQERTVTTEYPNKRLRKVEKKLKNIDKQLNSMTDMLQWIMKSSSEHHFSELVVPEVTKEGIDEKKKTTEALTLGSHNLEGQVKVLTLSRTSRYPGTNLRRFEVPNDKVPWDVEFPRYDPPTYISPELSKNPDWADKEDLYRIPIVQRGTVLKFNCVDFVTKTSRVSYAGKYQVKDGIPINPIGRTGLQNRGSLGRWGPNHVVDPVITRWKYDETGQKIMEDGKPVFEFVAVRRMDTGLWALPESILAPGRLPTDNLKIMFSEEALGAFGEDRLQKKKIKKQMEKLLRKGELIHQGYADDPRNTDNAWLESTVYLYQDENDILRHFSLTFDAGHPATWLAASSKVSLYDAHSGFIKLIAKRLGASF